MKDDKSPGPPDTRPPEGDDKPDSDQEFVSRRMEQLLRYQKALETPSGPDDTIPVSELEVRLEQLERLNDDLRNRLEEAARQQVPLLPPSPPGEIERILSEEVRLLRDENRKLRRKLEEAPPSPGPQPPAQPRSDPAVEAQLVGLKVRLADAVVEQKQLQDNARSMRDEIAALKKDLNQGQALARDLEMRLESSNKNERRLGQSEETLQDELRDAHRRLAEADEKYRVLFEEKALLLKEKDEILSRLKDYRDFLQQHEALKQQLAAAEIREGDLVTSFEALQRERGSLKEKLNRLLVGVKEYVSWKTPPDPSETILLEPQEFPFFFPLCFPDRLPKILRISWKPGFKEVPRKMTLKSGVGKIHAPPSFPIRAFRHLASAYPVTISLDREVMPLPDWEFDDPIVPDMRPRFNEARDLSLLSHAFPDNGFLPTNLAALVSPPVFLARAMPIDALIFSSPPRFEILLFSWEALLGHLGGTLRVIQFRSLRKVEFGLRDRAGLKMFRKTVSQFRLDVPRHSPITEMERPEKRFPLTPFVPQRGEMEATFRRGRLKMVLKSIESSITSIVEKYRPLVEPQKPEGGQQR